MKTISKRWIKNAVAIVVMLALCGSMVFTMSYAKSHAQASDMPQMSQGSGGTPPDQSGSSDSNSQSGDQQNIQGSGDQQNTQGSSGQQIGQPPAKPEDSVNSGQSGNSSNMPQGAPDQSSNLSTLYYILFGAECFLLVSVKSQHIASQCEI